MVAPPSEPVRTMDVIVIDILAQGPTGIVVVRRGAVPVGQDRVAARLRRVAQNQLGVKNRMADIAAWVRNLGQQLLDHAFGHGVDRLPDGG